MQAIMWNKDYQEDVEVYAITTQGDRFIALCYIPTLAGKQNGNGWVRVKMSRLVPYPYAEAYKTGMSKTERNKIKSMLKLSYAEWTCTDGSIFSHDKLEDAIAHQATLIKIEEEV